MKITKLLPVTLALLLGMSGAYAATETAQANYDLTLPEFFNVTATAPTASSVTYDDNYTVATIADSLSGNFHVISNTNTKEVYLYGVCSTDGGDAPALYGADASSLKLVFTNTATKGGTQAPATAVTAIRNGNAAAKDSPNAVAFSLTVTPALVADSHPADATITSVLEDNGKNVKYTIPNCAADFTCVVSGSTESNTFSTLDTNGLYRATLYMSTQAQTL